MLLKQAISTYWKKWAAKREYEELKDGIWLEPALALLRRTAKEEWTDKHRDVARKLVLEGGWVQKRFFDKEEGTEKHRLHHCPGWNEIRRGIPEAFRTSEQKVRTSKKEWKCQRGIVTHPPSESHWNRGHFSLKKWESEKHKSWGLPVEGFRDHVATDGSLLGTAGK